MAYRILSDEAPLLNHETFIGVSNSIGGWIANVFFWVESSIEETGWEGFWDIECSGPYSHSTRAKAVAMAQEWAKDEGLPVISG